MDTEAAPPPSNDDLTPKQLKTVHQWNDKLDTALKVKLSGVWLFPDGKAKSTVKDDAAHLFRSPDPQDIAFIQEVVLKDQRESVAKDFFDSCRQGTEPFLDQFFAKVTPADLHILTNCVAAINQWKLDKALDRRRKAIAQKYTASVTVLAPQNPPERMANEIQEDKRPAFATLPYSSRNTQLTFLSKTTKIMTALNAHLQRGMTVAKAAQFAHVSSNQLKWAKQKLKSGDLRRRIGQPLHRASMRRDPVYKEEMYTFIWEMVHFLKGKFTLRKMARLCQQSFPGQSSPCVATIRNMLAKMKVTKKLSAYVPPNRNTTLNKKRKAYYMARLILALDAGRLVIFVDETGVNYQSTVQKHYAPANTRLDQMASKPLVKNTTCLLATSQYGPVAALYIDGSCDSVVFLYFVHQIVRGVKQFSDTNKDRRPLLVLDNVAFHHSVAFQAYSQLNGLDILFTPSYSPMLNPVEYFNGHLKKKLANQILENKNTIVRECNLALEMATSATYKGFVDRTLKYAEDCLHLRDIID